MTNKERYIEWAGEQEYIPISMTPWWLDAVCAGKEWDALLAEDEQGNILGAMPYLLRKRAWYRYIVMPQLSQTGGIWVTAEVTADRWKTAEVCRQIKEQLDKMGLAYYYQQYLPGSLCVDAMRALGFKAHERVTYRVEDLSDLNKVIDSFSKNKRRQLQKALSLHAEHNKIEAEQFFQLHQQWLLARGRKVSYSREFLLVLERKAKRLKQCEILTICNADVLEAMKLAREKHVHFDFEGSMDRGIAKHYKQFGSIPVTYYAVEHYYKPVFRLAVWFQKLREWGYR